MEENIFELFDSYGRDTVPIYEMANIDPRAHNFGVALKMHVLQPGDKWPGHGPRVKFFKGNPNKDFFSVSLHPDASKVKVVDGHPEGLATESEVNILVRKVQQYRVPLWNMYFDTAMTQDELLDEMRDVDAGKEVPVRGGRYKMDQKKK